MTYNKALSSVNIAILISGFFCSTISEGVNVEAVTEYDLVISYANGLVWQKDVLNWPENQPLNLTCIIRKSYKNVRNPNHRGRNASTDLHLGNAKHKKDAKFNPAWKTQSFNLTWTMLAGNLIDKNRVWFHPKINSFLVPLTFEHGQGNQLKILDPERTRHTGKYVCEAVPKLHENDKEDKTVLESKLRAEIYINIIANRRTCGAGFFGCPSNKNHCIFSRYLCDGVPDCTESEDESENKCGPGDPCTGKIRCDGGRCMDPKDCCDPHLNASCPIVLPCCQAMIESNRRFYRQGMTDSHDMRLIHSTIYTIIGCVVAFMFILILVVIAICRFHIKRRWSFRYYTNSGSTETSENSLPAAGGRIISSINIRPTRRNQRSRRSRQLSGIRGASRPHPPITLHDLDIYFSSLRNVDASSGSGGGITYNINNGVQIVGAPPPYSQAAGIDGGNGQNSHVSADLPPPYRAEDEVQEAARDERNDRVVDAAPMPQDEHYNIGASIRRHVRRNRNLFGGGNGNPRQGSTTNSQPDLRNEARENEPLMEEVNNNAFNEGPVLNNVMEDEGEDGNNNGDINGNSEMIDLHNRRIQEEREREEQVRERNAQLSREQITINEIQDIDIDLISEFQRQHNNIVTEEQVVEPNPNSALTVQGAGGLDQQQITIEMQRHMSFIHNEEVPISDRDNSDIYKNFSSHNEPSVVVDVEILPEGSPRNTDVDASNHCEIDKNEDNDNLSASDQL